MILLSISALGEAFSPNSGLIPRRATSMAAGKSKQPMKPKEERGLGPFDELMYGKDGVGDYPPFGTLVRGGPVPFLKRVTGPQKYSASVKKFMYEEKCELIEAQANIDAFLANPNDWAFAKMASERGKENTYDFVNVNCRPGDLLLTAVW
eukprot:CAMPEP_0172593466 /NCGR_PEP_ID=MMETSP1068-20121228/12667_1 /TAXON_ID=35684 /ORGANISM="Pseudopedinella elastica, Strain CCMP716" /LENGTH=149 /DNA_ID=CAMNT_0013391001 /DNA_START=137 /DNA_END=583 /DNA_ORIENTATION=-